MLIIRFQRVGKKNQPYFRIVLIEHSRKVGGKYNEMLGSYNPRTKEAHLEKDRIQYWLSKGVKASPTTHNLLVKQEVISGPKVQAWKPKKKAGGEKSSEVKTAAAALASENAAPAVKAPAESNTAAA